MKRLIPVSLLLATAIATGSATAAPATADSCVTIARQLSQKSGEFVKVNADGRNVAQPPNARPADFYRSLLAGESFLPVGVAVSVGFAS